MSPWMKRDPGDPGNPGVGQLAERPRTVRPAAAATQLWSIPTTDVPLPGGGSDYLIRHTTLRQLQLLEAIVRLGSFTRAAEELFLTQPTVSMQIKKLSDALGTPLFRQVGRSVEPTDAGREVNAAGREILNTLCNLEITLADLKGLKRGRLRLGVLTTAAYVAPEILGAFCQRYPGIDVQLQVTNRENTLERLTDHDDDLYLMGQPREDSDQIESVPFAPNPLVMVARVDHPLATQRNIPVSRLAQENLILREPGSGVRDAVLKQFAEAGLKPRVRMQLGSNEAIKHAIVGGLGISALSLHSLTLDSAAGRLVLLDVRAFRSCAAGTWCIGVVASCRWWRAPFSTSRSNTSPRSTPGWRRPRPPSSAPANG
jgi:DNA-binding transcriptional LysR family regulator